MWTSSLAGCRTVKDRARSALEKVGQAVHPVLDQAAQKNGSEDRDMRRSVDDFDEWREQQENASKTFPYVYPQMPPRFQRCCRWFKALFLLEWCGIILLILGGAVGCVLIVVEPQAEQLIDFGGTTCAAGVVLSLTCRLFRRAPRFFWHCPHCGAAFPYYAPSHYSDVLKEEDSLHQMDHLRIPYIKIKFCPLVVPSVCPECKSKFFKIPDDPSETPMETKIRRSN